MGEIKKWTHYLLFFVIFSLFIFCFAVAAQVETVPTETSDLVTLDFKDADIHSVLRILSLKGGVDIVTTPDISANISIKLTDVPWQSALGVILKTYGFAYERDGKIITVSTTEKINEMREQELIKTRIFVLRYLDAYDVADMLKNQLSPNGKMDVLPIKRQRGWKAGAAVSEPKAGVKLGEISETELGEDKSKQKARVLMVTDKESIIKKFEEILKEIDVMPRQILIETRIMEVNRDKLRDIGFDYGTGQSGASSSTITQTPIEKNHSRGIDMASIGGHILGNQVTPAIFGPQATSITTANTGLKLIYKKLTGNQFEIILHALEEDVWTNTLSAPHVTTLDCQEAYIMVGDQTPILSSQLSAGDDNTAPSINQSLDYYQDIGIQLNVLPKICAKNQINLLVQPTITSSTANVTATSIVGSGTSQTTSSINYPIIKIRQAKTQVLLDDGDTVVIGGLLKDVKSRDITGIPFISKLPWIGALFSRETTDISKIDLLIFITVRIIKEEDFTPEQLMYLEERMTEGYDTLKEAKEKKRFRNKENKKAKEQKK